MPCLDTIQTINKTDCIGNSRETINGNFQSVKNYVCQLRVEHDITEAKTIHDVPIYGIIMYYGDITPGGTDFELNGRGKVTKNLQSYALCNGQNGTPDMRDRFVVGAGMNYEHKTYGPGTITNDNSSLSLAFSSVKLTIPEMPTHNHGITDAGHNHEGTALDKWTGGSSKHKHELKPPTGSWQDSDATGNDSGWQNDDGGKMETETETDGEHTHKLSIQDRVTGIKINNEGNSLKHENRPPYIALGYIMRCPSP